MSCRSLLVYIIVTLLIRLCCRCFNTTGEMIIVAIANENVNMEVVKAETFSDDTVQRNAK